MDGCTTCLIFRLSAFGLQWFSSRVHASSSLLYPFRIGQFLAAPLVTLRGQLNKCYLNLKSKCLHFFPSLRKKTLGNYGEMEKCQFLAKFGRFWAQNPIFWGQGVKILVPSYRDSNETPFSCWKHWSARLQLAARGENVLFLPQNLDIWGQKSIFCLVIAIFVDGTNDHYTRGYNFPIGSTPKKFPFPSYGSFLGLIPVFGHFGPLPNCYK